MFLDELYANILVTRKGDVNPFPEASAEPEKVVFQAVLERGEMG
jgi:hypothetical protein